MNRISWSMQRSLGITEEEARSAEVRAERIEQSARTDGAYEYVNLTPEGLKFASIRDGHLMSDAAMRKLLKR